MRVTHLVLNFTTMGNITNLIMKLIKIMVKVKRNYLRKKIILKSKLRADI